MKVLRKYAIWCLLFLFLMPVLAFGIWYGRQVRQNNLDHALIEAIKKQQTQKAIDLLNEGADANATDKPYQSLTLTGMLRDFWAVMQRRHTSQNSEYYRSTLLLAYGPVLFNPPDTSLMELINSDGNVGSADFFNHNNDKEARSPLISALIEHGANLSKDQEGTTLLAYACICNDRQIIKILLKHHVDVNAMGETGYLPLMCTNEVDCAQLLLEAGAKVNATDESGETQLMCVFDPKMYPLLFQYHADPNVQDKEGKTALIHLFVSVYQPDENIRAGMHILLQHGAKVSIKDRAGKTALDYARAGKANWMTSANTTLRYDKDVIPLLEAAMKKEQAEHHKTGTRTE